MGDGIIDQKIAMTFLVPSLHCPPIGMVRANFSPFGSGFGFFDFAGVMFRVFGFFLGLRNFVFGFTLGPSFLK